jgi:alpha-tubulin suppressor-like RCC1 family protein
MTTRDFFVSILSTLTALAMLIGPATGEAATRGRFRAETVRDDAAARISSGGGHSCQVNEDGTIRCWGSNEFGQLGNGTTSTEIVRVPGLVSGITDAVAVSAGPNYTCALLSGGSVRCWGLNGGILGDGTVDNRSTPVAVVGLTNAVAIATGGNHACAVLADGTARCWGGNSDGRLGDGTTTNRLTPVTVSGIGTAVAIAMGYRHTCALLANGSVRCWGENLFGQLGIGITGGANRLTPVALSSVSNAVAITAATYHTCVLLADGTARCWGLNGGAGVLGDGTSVDRNAPVTVSGLSNAVAIDTGDNHTCALQANSNPKCWGFNASGQLGDGTTTSRLTPVDVITPSPNNAVGVSAGGAHSCALLADGSAKCWGNNQTGQLGISNVAPSNLAPTPVLGGGGGASARDIAAGRNHTCAVRADGTVACWGANDSGQLGIGTTDPQLSPVTVSSLTDPAVAIAAGESHTCALVASGTVRCWGLNSNGQLGDGTTTTRLTPVTVPGVVNAIAIAAGGTLGASHTCALFADGAVRCWGANGSGQLGNNTTTQSLLPAVSTFNAVAIAVGEQHTCALLANGFPFCWGLNNRGQLGEGTNSTRLTPIIVNLENTVAIAGGNTHTCALRVDGTSWCWGGNLLGQLGIGSTTSQSVPTFTNVLSAAGIAGGFGHSCAVQADGKALCWGDNGSGQLGNATTTPSLTPVTVGTVIHGIGVSFFRPLGGMVGVTTGRRHSCALMATGRVVCWGENTVGQLGIGSTENQSSPVTVSPFTFIPAPAPDGDADGIADASDNCPSFANATQADADGNGRGDACECGDQNADGRVNVSDTVAINQAIFDPTRVTPLCDANNDGICNVSDIVAVNRTIFVPKTSVCARQPVPGP